jgi:hypothetical protein
MITETTDKRQRKKRDAAYYREYRRRKKIGDSGNILQFPAVTTQNPPGTFSVAAPAQQPKWREENSRILNSKNIMVTIFVILLTGMLVYLSAPFYMQGHSKPIAYLMAALIELSLLFLLTIQTSGNLEKLAKYFLLVSLSAYALVPIALNPIKETRNKITEAQNQTEIQLLKVKSIQSEISTRKQKSEILQQRGRVTLAQLELQKIAELQSELRNTINQAQPTVNSEIEIRSAYAFAIQRLLLMLCNLFFVHHLIALFRLQDVAQKKKTFLPRQMDICAT